MRVAHVALAVLLVLAGCTGTEDTVLIETHTETAVPDTPTSTATSARTETATATPTATPARTPTPTATATVLSDDNPWGQRIVRVAVNDTVRDGRNTTAIVQRAVTYWNAEMRSHTDYAFRFRVTDHPENARIEVRFVDRIDECNGPSTNTAGCARLIEPDETARDLEVARVVSNGSNAAVTGTTKHELGHLLGLDHADTPRFLMAQNSTTPVRNASERANPWWTDTIQVAVDYDGIDGDETTVDEQVGHAIDFYDAGAEGTIPTNISVGRTDERHAAEILVTNDPSICNVSGGSQSSLQGHSSDQDTALEAHTRATVCVDVEADAVGWHVGYWLGNAFGLSPDELASPFQNASYDDRRSEWWE